MPSLSFWAWPLLLSVVCSRAVHAEHASHVDSFSWPSNMPFWVETTFRLSTPLLMDAWLVSSVWLLWTILPCTLLWGKCCWSSCFQGFGGFFACIPRGETAESHTSSMANLLIHGKLSPKASAPFYIPTSLRDDSNLSTSSSTLLVFH